MGGIKEKRGGRKALDSEYGCEQRYLTVAQFISELVFLFIDEPPLCRYTEKVWALPLILQIA
jgi:hypothetical protein